MLTKSSTVLFKHVVIPVQNSSINGICLSYNSKRDAESFFSSLFKYLSASGTIPRRLFEVSANQENDKTYSLVIVFGLKNDIRHIEIIGIEKQYIENIKDSLKTFEYFLLIASFTKYDGEIEVLPVGQYHLFLNRIIINNIQYVGQPVLNIDWAYLLQTDIIYQIKE